MKNRGWVHIRVGDEADAIKLSQVLKEGRLSKIQDVTISPWTKKVETDYSITKFRRIARKEKLSNPGEIKPVTPWVVSAGLSTPGFKAGGLRMIRGQLKGSGIKLMSVTVGTAWLCKSCDPENYYPADWSRCSNGHPRSIG